jgi:hypothetical protein
MITVLRRTEGKLTVSAVCLAPAHLVDDGGDRLGLKVTLEGDYSVCGQIRSHNQLPPTNADRCLVTAMTGEAILVISPLGQGPIATGTMRPTRSFLSHGAQCGVLVMSRNVHRIVVAALVSTVPGLAGQAVSASRKANGISTMRTRYPVSARCGGPSACQLCWSKRLAPAMKRQRRFP